jgi:hypothetical protein
MAEHEIFNEQRVSELITQYQNAITGIAKSSSRPIPRLFDTSESKSGIALPTEGCIVTLFRGVWTD